MVITHSVISTPTQQLTDPIEITITDQQVHNSTIRLTLIYNSDKENDGTLALAQ
jgi:hypothetical protein